METKLYKTTFEDIKEAATILKYGGLVAFPTETVYGLGADAFDSTAANKAYAAKGRPSDNPLIVHISKLDDLKRLVPKELLPQESSHDSSDKENVCGKLIKKLADTFWPGPLTIILPKLPDVPKETTGGLDTVAIRMPKDEWTLKFIEESGTLVSGPSANTSGYPSPTTWQHVQHDLGGKIDGIICGVPCGVGIESTVISLLDFAKENIDSEIKKPLIKILRPGFITPEMLAQVTGFDVEYDSALLSKPKLDNKGNANDDPDFHPAAPGMKYKHYAPKAEMILAKFHLQESEASDSIEYKKALEERSKIYCEKNGIPFSKVSIIYPSTSDFYGQLRKADEAGIQLIISPYLENESSRTFSLMNRVLKAAGYKIVEI